MIRKYHNHKLQTPRGRAAQPSYSRKCASLEETFKLFLASCPHSPTLMTALPDDVRRFLIWKDNQGKTKVHRTECQFLGEYGVTPCSCLLRLSSGSVDGIIQQLKKIFTNLSRRGEWDSSTGLGNPATSLFLKQYLKFIKEEQAQANVSPKQAKPIFLTKLKSIASYIDRQMQRYDLSIAERFVLA